MARLQGKTLFFITSPRTPMKMLPEIEMMSIFFLIFLRACIMTRSAIWSEIWSLPDRHTKDSALTKSFLAATKIKRLRMGSRVDRYLKDIAYQAEYLTRLIKEYKGHYLLTNHDTNHLDYKLALISSFSFCTRDEKSGLNGRWGHGNASARQSPEWEKQPCHQFFRVKKSTIYIYVKTDEIPLFFVPKLFPMFFVTKMREIFVNLSHFSWCE